MSATQFRERIREAQEEETTQEPGSEPDGEVSPGSDVQTHTSAQVAQEEETTQEPYSEPDGDAVSVLSNSNHDDSSSEDEAMPPPRTSPPAATSASSGSLGDSSEDEAMPPPRNTTPMPATTSEACPPGQVVETSALSLFRELLPQVKRIRMTTGESPRRVSVYDVIQAITGLDSYYKTWKDMCERHPEVVRYTSFQFPGQGQRPTPCADVENICRIIMLLPGHIAAIAPRYGEAEVRR
jgi:hypothetical protein